MKKVALPVLIFGLFLGHLAHAEDPLLAQIEGDLNTYINETANEGESNAKVLKTDKVPEIKCSNVIFNKGRKIVFCTAQIQTTFVEDKSHHALVTCTSLGYFLNKKSEIDTHYNPESFQKCLEKVYDSSYE